MQELKRAHGRSLARVYVDSGKIFPILYLVLVHVHVHFGLLFLHVQRVCTIVATQVLAYDYIRSLLYLLQIVPIYMLLPP